MQRKKIDSRVRLLIENAVRTQQRALFLVVGDRARQHVMHFHYMLSKAQVKARPSVLWCFKNDLGFTADRKKRNREGKKKGNEEMDPFELFLSATNIRYCYYRETENILGNTFGMCVLQDFEAITPNILARTVETVSGGGVVMVLLRTMHSLRQMYSMAMDVHQRYTLNPSHEPIRARFNERFLLSLARCSAALVLDDQLNVLPLSAAARTVEPVNVSEAEMEGDHMVTPEERELRRLQTSMQDTPTAGPLIQLCRTADQATAVMQCIDAVADRSLRTTVAVTAGRGRGKSAALGLAVGAAVGHGYSNMFVTSPAPHNLGTFFEFVVRALEAQGLVEHQDYEVVQATGGGDIRGCVVRVNVFREHRQTVQYIRPGDAARLGQAELLVIDEAAAIPLPLVRSLLGPYLVFMASTINGYEGTGRSLSLKLIQQLREQAGTAGSGARQLREVTLEHPIRYAAGDPIERWLHDVLCLDATEAAPASAGNGCPHPSECELYHVNRDTLFSYHRTSEVFLHRLMALFVASHYKNTPNDLQLLSDAPNHEVFVLLGPVDEQRGVPDILCAVQVAFEGGIDRRTLSANMVRGTRPPGDLIPYTVSTQYQDTEFGRMRGVRVVRIATHSEYQRMGYGSRTLDLLLRYFAGMITGGEREGEEGTNTTTASHNKGKDEPHTTRTTDPDRDVKLTEQIAPRRKLPPLLRAAAEREAESVSWVGVSFGLTLKLFNFWHRAGFRTVYVRLTPNDLTGEHTAIMLHNIGNADNEPWLERFHSDLRARFAGLLGYQFRSFHPTLALSILTQQEPEQRVLSRQVVSSVLSEYDLRRLESYSRNLVDYHLVLDVLPTLARWAFTGRLPVSLSFSIAAVVLAMGLQHKTVDVVSEEVKLESNQVLALFNKAMRKVYTALQNILSVDSDETIEKVTPNSHASKVPDIISVTTGGDATKQESESNQVSSSKKNKISAEYKSAIKQEQSRLVKSVLSRKDHYAVQGTEEEWDQAVAGGPAISGVSVRTGKNESGKKKGRGKKRRNNTLYDKKDSGKKKRRQS